MRNCRKNQSHWISFQFIKYFVRTDSRMTLRGISLLFRNPSDFSTIKKWNTFWFRFLLFVFTYLLDRNCISQVVTFGWALSLCLTYWAQVWFHIKNNRNSFSQKYALQVSPIMAFNWKLWTKRFVDREGQWLGINSKLYSNVGTKLEVYIILFREFQLPSNG